MEFDPRNLPLTGGCQCGACRYEIVAAPLTFYLCHCAECRAQSGSAFGLSVIVPAEALREVAGKPRAWTRRTDRGGEMTCKFCTDCGTRLWHQADPSVVSVKGGSLDAPPDLTGAAQIWTRSAVMRIDLGGPVYETQPEGRPPAPPRWRKA